MAMGESSYRERPSMTGNREASIRACRLAVAMCCPLASIRHQRPEGANLCRIKEHTGSAVDLCYLFGLYRTQ